jgi:hypothetical protein
METRFQRKLIIAIAHDIGVLHRRRGLPPLYQEPGAHFAQLAARTAGVNLPAADASRWETAALIAYRGGYDRPPEESPLTQPRPSPPRARRAREDTVHALPSTL